MIDNSVITLTVPELAKRWSCRETKVRKMIDNGKLRAFRIARYVKIDLVEIRRVEEQARVSKTSRVKQERLDPEIARFID